MIDRGSVDGLPVRDRCLVMGIVNATPDSFSHGGRYLKTSRGRRRSRCRNRAGQATRSAGGGRRRPGTRRTGSGTRLRQAASAQLGTALQPRRDPGSRPSGAHRSIAEVLSSGRYSPVPVVRRLHPRHETKLLPLSPLLQQPPELTACDSNEVGSSLEAVRVAAAWTAEHATRAPARADVRPAEESQHNAARNNSTSKDRMHA